MIHLVQVFVLRGFNQYKAVRISNQSDISKMERWNGRVAVVTGASSGIGAAIAKELAQAGLVTVGLARRVERVDALRDQIPKQFSANLHAIKCDVSKEEDIGRVFQEIVAKFGGIDVLINNAGIVRESMRLLSEDSEGAQPLRDILDTNVLGLTLCSRKACKSMRDRSVDGHIIHINSIAGHRVLNFPHMNMYSASKFAVTALTETMRNELREMKSKVKVTVSDILILIVIKWAY